ncbi:MAG: hypothetical protein ACYDH5_20325, partial [Acidimicrobiales bacterium]
ARALERSRIASSCAATAKSDEVFAASAAARGVNLTRPEDEMENEMEPVPGWVREQSDDDDEARRGWVPAPKPEPVPAAAAAAAHEAAFLAALD